MIQVQTLRFIFSIVPVKELGAVKGLKRFVCFYKDTEVKIRWVKNILDPMLRCLLGFDVVEGCEIICRKHWLLKVMLKRSWKYQHETFHVVHICWRCSPKLVIFLKSIFFEVILLTGVSFGLLWDVVFRCLWGPDWIWSSTLDAHRICCRLSAWCAQPCVWWGNVQMYLPTCGVLNALPWRSFMW